MATVKSTLDRVRSTLSSHSGALRRAMRCEDPVKSDAVVGFLDPLEGLRSTLNTAEVEELAERLEYQSQLIDWGLAACDLSEAIREQLEDFDVHAFNGLAATFEAHSQALSRVLSTTKVDDVEYQEAIESLCHASRFLPDGTDGFQFWVSNFGHKYSVDLITFKTQILASYHDLIEDRTWMQLKASLDKSNTGRVTVMKWGAFLEGFGSNVTAALQQMRETLGERYFAGFISYAESVALLSTCSPGAFLIRFSTSQPCSLVLARKTEVSGGKGTKILQTLITPRRGCFEVDGTQFTSLREVIDAFPDECRFPAPTVKTIARAKYFKGFLSRDQTGQLLSGERDGTFLFRFSESEPGALVVGYKENNVVRQTRIYSEPEKGGYYLDGTTQLYPTIEDIVKKNNSRLKYGYQDKDDRDGSGSLVNHASGSRSPVMSMNDRYGGVNFTPLSLHSSPSDQYGFVDTLM